MISILQKIILPLRNFFVKDFLGWSGEFFPVILTVMAFLVGVYYLSAKKFLVGRILGVMAIAFGLFWAVLLMLCSTKTAELHQYRHYIRFFSGYWIAFCATIYLSTYCNFDDRETKVYLILGTLIEESTGNTADRNCWYIPLVFLVILTLLFWGVLSIISSLLVVGIVLVLLLLIIGALFILEMVAYFKEF